MSGGHEAALGTLPTAGILAGATLGVFALIAIAVATVSARDEGRYRPGLSAEPEPVWFNGPGPGPGPGPGSGSGAGSDDVGGVGGSW